MIRIVEKNLLEIINAAINQNGCYYPNKFQYILVNCPVLLREPGQVNIVKYCIDKINLVLDAPELVNKNTTGVFLQSPYDTPNEVDEDLDIEWYADEFYYFNDESRKQEGEKIINFLTELKIKLEDLLTRFTITIDKPEKNDEELVEEEELDEGFRVDADDKIQLSNSTIAYLAIQLQREGIIDNNLNNTDLAKLAANLFQGSKEQVRKLLSTVSKTRPNSRVKTQIDRVIKAISVD